MQVPKKNRLVRHVILIRVSSGRPLPLTGITLRGSATLPDGRPFLSHQLKKPPRPGAFTAHAVAERPRVASRGEEPQVLEKGAGGGVAGVHSQQRRLLGEPAVDLELRVSPDLARHGPLGLRRAEAG